ncbi:Hypothetical protein NTJ_04113 [Nesidiocoris tenuis]|uniref:Uncharacterized protein n=1 Tax=Nesidiocoris tenuis TaxID=355587 RepID=A0ABN7AKA5_9HEMI|nr:Hypothetical protein NTJ_04113 [Nesidiocoris tenuis]
MFLILAANRLLNSDATEAPQFGWLGSSATAGTPSPQRVSSSEKSSLIRWQGPPPSTPLPDQLVVAWHGVTVDYYVLPTRRLLRTAIGRKSGPKKLIVASLRGHQQHDLGTCCFCLQ